MFVWIAFLFVDNFISLFILKSIQSFQWSFLSRNTSKHSISSIQSKINEGSFSVSFPFVFLLFTLFIFIDYQSLFSFRYLSQRTPFRFIWVGFLRQVYIYFGNLVKWFPFIPTCFHWIKFIFHHQINITTNWMKLTKP